MSGSSNAVLIVDDDEFQRELLSYQLGQLGFQEILNAANGTQALQLLDSHLSRVVLLISDLSMPDMDGVVLMRHLANRGFNGGVILFSGMQDEILASAAGLAQAHKLRILGYLSKPCDPLQLRQLVAGLARAPQTAGDSPLASALGPSRLQAALAAQEFTAWYQPQIDLTSGCVVGVEALARWPQADGSEISPALFVPALESAGLVDALFFRMAEQAIAAQQGWRGLPALTVSLNLSMDTTLDLDMPERLLHMVRAANLKPSDFVIEVTESRLMVERSLAMESLTRLSMMGFQLSIDDFGTGYSSLVQLIDLPFNELKIDGGFVQRADTQPKGQAIVRIASMLGRQLGMTVVAEGVETAAQQAFVQACGCHRLQGFVQARPMPEATLTHWLRLQRRP